MAEDLVRTSFLPLRSPKKKRGGSSRTTLSRTPEVMEEGRSTFSSSCFPSKKERGKGKRIGMAVLLSTHGRRKRKERKDLVFNTFFSSSFEIWRERRKEKKSYTKSLVSAGSRREERKEECRTFYSFQPSSKRGEKSIPGFRSPYPSCADQGKGGGKEKNNRTHLLFPPFWGGKKEGKVRAAEKGRLSCLRSSGSRLWKEGKRGKFDRDTRGGPALPYSAGQGGRSKRRGGGCSHRHHLPSTKKRKEGEEFAAQDVIRLQ